MYQFSQIPKNYSSRSKWKILKFIHIYSSMHFVLSSNVKRKLSKWIQNGGIKNREAMVITFSVILNRLDFHTVFIADIHFVRWQRYHWIPGNVFPGTPWNFAFILPYEFSRHSFRFGYRVIFDSPHKTWRWRRTTRQC